MAEAETVLTGFTEQDDLAGTVKAREAHAAL